MGSWPHMFHGGMWLGGGWMWVFWLVILIALAAGLMALIRRGRSTPGSYGDPASRNSGRSGSSVDPRPSESDDASEILKKRYASGEISREEFEQMKRDLRS